MHCEDLDEERGGGLISPVAADSFGSLRRRNSSTQTELPRLTYSVGNELQDRRDRDEVWSVSTRAVSEETGAQSQVAKY